MADYTVRSESPGEDGAPQAVEWATKRGLDGQYHYVVAVSDADGNMQPVFERCLEPWLEPPQYATIEWPEVATALKRLLRDILHVAAVGEEHREPLPWDALILAEHATGGALSVLACAAEEWAGERLMTQEGYGQAWADIDECVEIAAGWAPLLREDFRDRSILRALASGGCVEPDPSRLAGARAGKRRQ